MFTAPETNSNDEEILDYLNAPYQLSTPLESFTTSEIRKEIELLNTHKAPGYDLITAEILKHLPKKAVELIRKIFDGMLRLCYFPIQWKHAHVIMTEKPGKDPSEVTSYRPISLLPTLSKLFERLLLNRIVSADILRNLIPDHQFGFRQRHSTIQQCHRVVNKIRETLENKKMCSSVFLDIEQAFDRVWHTGLLYKIKKHMSDQLFLLLKSYLTDRYFQVKVDEALSDFHPIQAGVPQGSVLGPILYLIFTADIPQTNDTLLATFADDTAIMSTNADPTEASHKLQLHLDLLQKWFVKWKIKVNNSKSAHITFTLKKSTCPRVCFNQAPIPVKTEVKYLGLHLDDKLTWKRHIKAKRRLLDLKVKKMYWLLKRKSQLSLENKILIYKCILRPIWTYGIELWGCSKPTNTKILQTFQSKTLRMMSDAPWYVSNKTLHNDLNVPYVTEVIKHFSTKYETRTNDHENPLINELLHTNYPRRLKRTWPEDLSR